MQYMGRTNATIESESMDEDDHVSTDDAVGRDHTTAAAGTLAATIAATRTTSEDADDPLPNTLTIIGHDSPSSFEITVDGDIELLEAESVTDATIVSGTTVEGTVESGTVRFRFSGDLTDVTLVDRRITGLSPAATPNVHVDYSAPECLRS